MCPWINKPSYGRKLSPYPGGGAVETNIYGRLWPRFLRFNEQFLDLFVRRAEELLQSSRPFRIKLPQTERPSLAGKGSTNEHHLNHVSEAGVFSMILLMRFCSIKTS